MSRVSKSNLICLTLFLAGVSTAMFPDGPYGPPKEVKKGVLYMSMFSGVPIIPVTFDFTKAKTFRINSWDRKIFLLPHSTVTIKLGEPIYVTKENLAQSQERLKIALGE